MADPRQPVEIRGFVFATTTEGYLLESEVRQSLDGIGQQLDALQAENAELRTRLDHLVSLERLAQATVIKADELAAEIEGQARERAQALVTSCEMELQERRRRVEEEAAAELAAMRARAAQLQTALEGSLQTLGRALQAAGAPALEMPPASILPAESDGEARPTPPPAEAPAPAASAAPPEVSSPAPGGPSPTRAVPTEERSERIDVVEAPVGTEDGSGSENTHFGSMGAVPPLEVEEPVSPPPASEPAGTAQVAGSEPVGTAEVAGAEPAGVEAAAGPPVEELAAAPMETESAPRAQPPEAKPEERTQEVLGTLTVQSDPITGGGITRSGPPTLEIDLRPVKSFADLARVTKLLGRVAPGAQPVDLNLPQQRALFSIRGREPQALASQLQEALPEARVVEREGGLDVLLGEEEEGR